MDVGIDGALAIGGILSLGPLRLPSGGDPEVGGEGVRLVVGDVPDDLVVAIAVGAHGVIHLDLVEGVGGDGAVPSLGICFAENGEPGATMVALGSFA